MRTLVNDPAFDFGELRFDWADVVLAAIGWQEWQELERSLAEGLACQSDAQAGGERLEPEALRDATLAFRRARGLLAAEDYLRWLADRGLATADLDAHLTRKALRERRGDQVRAILAHNRPDGGALAAAIRGEAVLGGRLRWWAERLARCAAAHRGLASAGTEAPSVLPGARAALVDAVVGCPACGVSPAQAAERAERITVLLEAEREFCAGVLTPERIERSLAEHRLDWQRLAWEEVDFASEGAAREAALAVRADGLALGEVAGLVRATTNLRADYCGDLPELAAMLVGAVPGELLGPFAADGGWRLACVLDRTPPSAQDPVLHSRASAEAVDDALERHLAGAVSWHVER